MLHASVQSILAMDALPAELLIVDQSDRSNAALEDLSTGCACEIVYVHDRSVGLSRANNLGIRTARHPILTFTHDDVRVTATWLADLVHALVQAGPRTVVTGRVLPGDAEVPGGFAPSIKTEEVPAVFEGRIREDPLYPMSMAMYRSIFDELGLFDERLGPGTPFPGAEDNDFGFRLLTAGYSIHYVPKAVLYHRAWRSRGQWNALNWAYGTAQGAFFAKHFSLRDTFILRRAARVVCDSLWESHSHPCTAREQAFYIAALASGAVSWWVRYGPARHG